MPLKHEILAEGIEIYCGDCREILPTLGKVDAVVTDPPYGISYKSPSGSGMTSRGNYDIIAGDTVNFDPTPFLHYPEVVLFGANHFANKLPNSARWLVWDKRAGMTSNNNSDCEMAWVKTGGSARLITHLWNGMLKDSEKDQKRVHPTQKPVAVMEWILNQTTKAGQTVLDAYMGSGTTGVACFKMGRRFIGIEIDEKYYDISRKRLSDSMLSPDFFIKTPKPKQENLTLDI